ncbi:hypothetical protein PoB_003850600 [Plakobranchus ocellatus]|uniref:Uncharacterized protein n=1 Tax=Plakobranchus ocellatus TaxID=259542 RepID=A0AAV4AZL3_9GAST|nr:hypothetical protein PoB_003850600 [Plakobranchus ocellatus]
MANNDLLICREFTASRFILVKGSTLIHLDLQPFLTRSQLDNGSETSWFKLTHLQEVIDLLKTPLESYLDNEECSDDKKKADKSKSNKEFVLTGTTVRAACSFRSRPEGDIFLMDMARPSGKFTTTIGSSKPRSPSFTQMHVHHEKLICFICPRSNSSGLQLSQFMNTTIGGEHEDISKYFHPLTS